MPELGPAESKLGAREAEFGLREPELGAHETEFALRETAFGPAEPELGPAERDVEPPETERAPPSTNVGPTRSEFGFPEPNHDIGGVVDDFSDVVDDIRGAVDGFPVAADDIPIAVDDSVEAVDDITHAVNDSAVAVDDTANAVNGFEDVVDGIVFTVDGFADVVNGFQPGVSSAERNGMAAKKTALVKRHADKPDAEQPMTAALARLEKPPATISPTEKYEALARDFLAAIEILRAAAPAIKPTDNQGPGFIRTHLGIPPEAIRSALAGAKYIPTIAALHQLDVEEFEDGQAFFFDFPKAITAFEHAAKELRRRSNVRYANMAATALKIYAMAKTLAAHSNDPRLKAFVKDMQRDLGRRVKQRKKKTPKPAMPGEGTAPAPGRKAAKRKR
jgi:hypothetical protein